MDRDTPRQNAATAREALTATRRYRPSIPVASGPRNATAGNADRGRSTNRAASMKFADLGD